jgi:glycosyltransferase involved in cell wall biosynthesis
MSPADDGTTHTPDATAGPAAGRRRILLIARGLDRVGTGAQIELAAGSLAASGWDVHVAMLSSSGDLACRLRAAGVEVHAVSRRPAVTTGCLPALIAILRRLRPAVVESWGWSASWVATVAAGLCGMPLACRIGTGPGRSWRRRRVLRAAGLVMADSPALAEACRGHLLPETLLRTVPPAAPPERTRLDRIHLAERLGLPPDRPWTLCVAPIEAASRLEHLLFAIDQLEIILPDVQHVLVGQGGQWPRIARRQRAQDIGDRLHRFESLELVDRLVPHAAVVWQAGDVALGGAILEGMLAGVPAVAVAGPAASALVDDGQTGFLVAPEPSADFTRRAFQLLESPPLAERMGREARAMAEEAFPPGRSAAAHSAAIETLAAT